MFFNRPSTTLTERLNNLEKHLAEEHPDLLSVLPTYMKLDKVLYRLGLLTADESLATRITWWPLISVLGTFSSGKSTFINHTLGKVLQRTGNQAVDDKFTVMCYAAHENSRTLPGSALNHDPRFPFFGIGEEIEKVAEGEGRRIDTYLQLKTADTDVLKGRTLIDSPGFDADDQRRSTLRLTDHIIDISDLVLIFFDARHPEPGAMQDTLTHLVSKATGRADSTKFMYVLNQIDTTAREDNPEEVVSAWQRALAQAGVASGRFLCIYNEDAAVHIEDTALRERYQRKRNEDMAEISRRMNEVEVERGYRVVSALEDVSRQVETEAVPMIEEAVAKWRKFVMVGDVLGIVVAAGLVWAALHFLGMETLQGAFDAVNGYIVSMIAVAAAIGVLGWSWHFTMRKLMTKWIAPALPDRYGEHELNIQNGFRKSTRVWRSAFTKGVSGWGKGTKRMLSEIIGAIEGHIQRLNDEHTDPSGRKAMRVELESQIRETEDKAEEEPVAETLVATSTEQVLAPSADQKVASN
ncbi:dynamin family protein [Magnetovibrio sp. PR-2]|uniref:dynamin family protein n=1 Tax=Magnetovibrio sp. PR-2 TaxID=3120356 RepID=UPI002FCE00DF